MLPRLNQAPVQPYHTAARKEEEQPESPIDDMEAEEVDRLLSPPQLLKLRPESARSSSEPSPSALLQSYFTGTGNSRPNSSHRTRSPYSRTHLRSWSSGATLSAPVMTRAHSMPSVHTARGFDSATPSTRSLSPAAGSPMRSPARVRSPFGAPTPEENPYQPPPRSPSWFENPVTGNAIESIQEDSELDLTPRQPLQPAPLHPSLARSGSLRRRPLSPLHSVSNASSTPTHQPPTSFPAHVIDSNAPLNMSTASSSGSSSPALGPQRYNEAYPPLHHYASTSSLSSMSSTPTSARSRSPSISSLETIEDAPDAESEAIESERIMRLKLAADRADRLERGEDVDDEPRRRSSLDVPRGFGFGRGGNSRERKRWSICGGERRGDLDLETIWED